MKHFSSLFSYACLAVAAVASNVVELTPKNFDDVVLKSGKPALVKFYAPWCGHCKKLAPVWEELADSLASQKGKVTIAKVDADDHKELGKRFGIQGFPTLKYFDGKSDTPIDYDSKRDLESLQTFIKEQSGTKAKVKKELPSKVVVLGDFNFDDVVNGDKNVLVEFYAPWCGHCKALAPVYEALAHTFASEEDVVIANLDADAANGKETARKFDVTGFPTLKFFPKGSTEPIPYDGSRTEAAFVKFLNDHAGTARTVGGGLSELGGRIATFDGELEALVKGDANSLKAVTKKIEKLAKASNDAYAAYYVKVLGKLKGGEGYVEKELERLKKILSKGGLVGKKQDELTAKANILAQFYAEKTSTKDEL